MHAFKENIHSGRLERWQLGPEGYRWVAAEPAKPAAPSQQEPTSPARFNLWGYSEESNIAENLGRNLTEEEASTAAEKFLTQDIQK
jgi:hypothetical protein